MFDVGVINCISNVLDVVSVAMNILIYFQK